MQLQIPRIRTTTTNVSVAALSNLINILNSSNTTVFLMKISPDSMFRVRISRNIHLHDDDETKLKKGHANELDFLTKSIHHTARCYMSV